MEGTETETEDMGGVAVVDVLTIDGEGEDGEDHQTGSVVAVDGKAAEVEMVVGEIVVTIGVTGETGRGRDEMMDRVAAAGEEDLLVDGVVGHLETGLKGEALAVQDEVAIMILLSRHRVHGVLGVVVVRQTVAGVALAQVADVQVSGRPQTLMEVVGEIRVNKSEDGDPHAQLVGGDLRKDQGAITEVVEDGALGRRPP